MAGLTYEVYLSVLHHFKHAEDFGHTLTDCGKLSIDDMEPVTVARVLTRYLRGVADNIDPDIVCVSCGEPRHAHHNGVSMTREPSPRCFNRFGPHMERP